jgi:hypothetical protein
MRHALYGSAPEEPTTASGREKGPTSRGSLPEAGRRIDGCCARDGSHRGGPAKPNALCSFDRTGHRPLIEAHVRRNSSHDPLMHRRSPNSRVLPIVILALSVMTILSAPVSAGAAARTGDSAPKTLWETYPLDPSGGKAKIEKPTFKNDNTSLPNRQDVRASTAVDRSGSAHFEQQPSSSTSRFQMIAAAIIVGTSIGTLILMRRPAVRIVRTVGGAVPMSTIVLSASMIFVSVIIGIGVVLFISPMLGP